MIKPLPGYVLIQPIEEEEKSVGGVYLPETSKDKPMKGKVIDIGSPYKSWYLLSDEERKQYSPVNRDRIVIYKKWINETIKEDGKEYLFVRFEDLLGIYG